MVIIYLPFSISPPLGCLGRLFKVSKVVSRQPESGGESFGPGRRRAAGVNSSLSQSPRILPRTRSVHTSRGERLPPARPGVRVAVKGKRMDGLWR